MQSAFTRLSQIETCWSLVCRAHAQNGESARRARQALLDRYGPAVRRYLQAALADAEAVDDLYQDFCVNLLRGDFHCAAPERGRFRYYVKTAVIHLVNDYYRRSRRQPVTIATELLAAEEPESRADAARFAEHWREQLLESCWSALAEYERRTGTPYYAALRLRVVEPQLRTAAIAERLAEQFGQPYQPDSVRVVIHRARVFFSDQLIDEVANSLQHASTEAIEAELIELGLLEYCRAALARYQEPAAPTAPPVRTIARQAN